MTLNVGDRVRRLPGGSVGPTHPVVGQIYTVTNPNRGYRLGRISIEGFTGDFGVQYFELAVPFPQRPKYSVYLISAISHQRVNLPNRDAYIGNWVCNTEAQCTRKVASLEAMEYVILAKKKITYELNWPEVVEANIPEDIDEEEEEDLP